jgi:uncharacterized protein YdhG (YjbR/CyaY superfamily)
MTTKKKAEKRPTKKTTKKAIVPGGVDEYIEKQSKVAQSRLRDIRVAIQSAAPGSTETVSYFQWPGYFYEGYDYNGMFAWFSFKAPYVRLHVRPPVLENNKKDVGEYTTTKAVISFPLDRALPKSLVKKLVKASIAEMKKGPKSN